MKTSLPFTAPSHLLRVLLCASLLAVAADAVDAKGRRSGSSSSSSSRPAPSKVDDDKDRGIHVTIRPGSSSSSSGGGSALRGNNFAPGSTGIPMHPIGSAEEQREEAERRAAALAAYEKAQAEKAAAAKEAAERAEAERIALEKAEAERAVRRAAEEKAEAARAAAAADRRKREQAVIDADVERVLQRARADYPVLDTPDGEAYLVAIRARQQQLVAAGMYPSVAMVEAIADHASAMAPRQKKETVQVQAAPIVSENKAFGGCRWVTPTKWSCN